MQIHYQPPEKEENPLEKYTISLTQLAREGKLDPVIGRDGEIRRLIQILSRRTKNNPVLLGDPGVGKTAIVEGLAQRIVSLDVPDVLKGKEVIALSLAGLLAGASFRGEFEKRLKKLLEQIEKAEGKYLLFIDELHTLVGAGSAEGALDAGNMLKPALARGTLHAIGATTVSEYRQSVEKDPALERRFQPVYVEEPSFEDTLAILRGIKEKYEVHHGIKIADEALVSAVSLSIRYLPERFLPDKAIDLIDEASSSAKIEIQSMPAELDKVKRALTQLDIQLAALKKEKGVKKEKEELEKKRRALQEKFDRLSKNWAKQKKIISKLSSFRVELDKLRVELEKAERDFLLDKAAELKYGKIPELEKKILKLEREWQTIPEEEKLLQEEVGSSDIAQVVSSWTGIPVSRLLTSERKRLLELEKELRKRVVGQDHALEKVASAIRRSRAGLSEEDRPYGSFLFLGPTGVGKTETAKALAYALFNDEKAMIRIDMSEYQEAHSAARLIGAPPGYVGFEEGGQLTEEVRRRPYSVILFDEIEKAHRQVFNVFLQLLDEGRLTDGQGRVVNFKNTIIIMTSNLASEVFKKEGSFKKQEEAVLEKVHQFFRPEFINRLDALVVYKPLSKEMIDQIFELQIKELRARLASQNLNIEITPEAKKYLTAAGFNPDFGARPLKRIINEEITDKLAIMILEGKIREGKRFVVDFEKGKIRLRSKGER